MDDTIDRAARFLSHPSVVGVNADQQREFLLAMGIEPTSIDAAFSRVRSAAAATTAASYASRSQLMHPSIITNAVAVPPLLLASHRGGGYARALLSTVVVAGVAGCVAGYMWAALNLSDKLRQFIDDDDADDTHNDGGVALSIGPMTRDETAGHLSSSTRSATPESRAMRDRRGVSIAYRAGVADVRARTAHAEGQLAELNALLATTAEFDERSTNVARNVQSVQPLQSMLTSLHAEVAAMRHDISSLVVSTAQRGLLPQVPLTDGGIAQPPSFTSFTGRDGDNELSATFFEAAAVSPPSASPMYVRGSERLGSSVHVSRRDADGTRKGELDFCASGGWQTRLPVRDDSVVDETANYSAADHRGMLLSPTNARASATGLSLDASDMSSLPSWSDHVGGIQGATATMHDGLGVARSNTDASYTTPLIFGVSALSANAPRATHADLAPPTSAAAPTAASPQPDSVSVVSQEALVDNVAAASVTKVPLKARIDAVRRAVETLLSRNSRIALNAAAPTLLLVLDNLRLRPEIPRYRRLPSTNEVFRRGIIRYVPRHISPTHLACYLLLVTPLARSSRLFILQS